MDRSDTIDRRRREPNASTLVDLMIAVVGLAAGLVVQPLRWETTRVVQTCGFYSNAVTYYSLFWTVARFALPPALAVGMVIVARRFRYGGPPRPAEWLALTVALILLDPSVPGSEHVNGPVVTREITYREVQGVRIPDRVVRSAVLVETSPDRPVGTVVLITTLAAGVLALGALLVVQQWRRGVSPGVATLCLIALVWVWLRVPPRLNPVEVVRFRYSWLTIVPIPRPAGWSQPAFEWYTEARLALGRWPLALLAAVPALATVLELRRRDLREWRWTEWAGMTLGLMLCLCWEWDELLLRPSPGPGVRATTFSVFLLALVIPAAWLARRFAPPGPAALAATAVSSDQLVPSVPLS